MKSSEAKEKLIKLGTRFEERSTRKSTLWSEDVFLSEAYEEWSI